MVGSGRGAEWEGVCGGDGVGRKEEEVKGKYGGGRWWEDFYGEELAVVLLETTSEEEVERTVDFVWEKVGVSVGDRVLDQCCGTGRLSVPMARRGLEVVGVDQAVGYVEGARGAAVEEGVEVEFVVGDGFEFVSEEPCDGVINWWTSFGYAGDEQNLEMLRRAFESLRPGGVFLLDTFNLAGVLRNFQARMETRGMGEEGEILLIRDSEVDLANGVMLKRWTYIFEDGRRVVHDSRVRAYMPDVLVQMLEQCGFEGIEIFGSVGGEAIGMDSERCIVLGRRPV